MRSTKELIDVYLENGEKPECISDDELKELGFLRPKRSQKEREAMKAKMHNRKK